MMILKALLVAMVALGAQASCEDGDSRSLAPAGYKCSSVTDGFCLACPEDEMNSSTFGGDGPDAVVCTCSGGEPCSVFKDGEALTMEAYLAAIAV